MSPTFLYNVYTYPFTRNPSRDEQDSSLISAHSITTVSKIRKFNINAHVHLGGHITLMRSLVPVPSFQLFIYIVLPLCHLHFIGDTVYVRELYAICAQN